MNIGKLLKNRWFGWVSVLLSLVITAHIAVVLTDELIPISSENNHTNRSAIAIRDDVTALQKFGSYWFSMPYLSKYYSNPVYITLDDNDDVSEFEDSLHSLLSKFDEVDIYLLAHGNDFYLSTMVVPDSLRKKIRMVYNTGCGGFSQSLDWLNLGADVYISHGESSLSPVFYLFFLRRLGQGHALADIVHEANEITDRRLNWFLGDTQAELQMKKDTRALIAGDSLLIPCQ